MAAGILAGSAVGRGVAGVVESTPKKMHPEMSMSKRVCAEGMGVGGGVGDIFCVQCTLVV